MNRSDKWVEGVGKIAVLRANALGDYIFATPALLALRAAYPRAEIVLLGREWHAAFLEDRPGPVDRVIALPPYRGVSRPDTWFDADKSREEELDQFFQRMADERFDLALQLHGGGGNSNPFIKRLGARLTAGLRATEAAALDRWIPYIYWQHEILRLIEVVELVGAPLVTIETQIEITQNDLIESYQAVADDGPPLAVIHPSASDSRRRWPAERFAAVGDALALAGLQVVLVGIPDERFIVDTVAAHMREPAINLCGLLTMNGLAGLLNRAAVVIANDSGPRHLAEALGTPTVGIYWCANLINAGSHYRALHRPHLSWRINCPVCGNNVLNEDCLHEDSFVDEIQTAEVITSVMELLAYTRVLPQKTHSSHEHFQTNQ
jgi:ADP-heptose:LPS heptosyltransferase